MKKKLMLISPMLHQGGFERVCVTTARLLEPYFDVIIVIFNSANIAYDVKGLHIIDINLGVKKGKLGKLIQLMKRSRRLKQLKKEIRPDISYSFGPSANMVNTLSKVKETKLWLGFRNYTDVEEKINIRLFIRYADLIICCSKKIEEELQKGFHFYKTVTLYNLYDVESIQKQAMEREPELPWKVEDGKCLISMGRDDDMKGFWHMLKVFSLMLKEIPELKLIILGAGDFNQYRRLAEDLQIQEAVCFAGMRRDPYIYLKKASLYLLTSINEGFPNALVEGMSLGLAAAAADCMTGPREILLKDYRKEDNKHKQCETIWGEYGVLLPTMETRKNLDARVFTAAEKESAAALIKLLSDEELLNRYKKAAGIRAGIFTYENYVHEFLRLTDGG